MVCGTRFFFVSQVAEYAVDSLKQLALKFVCKEELRDFNFQRLFLCPFESVFVATQHKDIKVLILDCLQNLVQVRDGEGGARGAVSFCSLSFLWCLFWLRRCTYLV